jgi:subtilisin family serine protease
MKRFPKSLTSSHGVSSVLDQTRVLVAFKKPIDIKEVSRLLKQVNLEVEFYKKSEENAPWIQINHTDQRYWLKTEDGKPISDNRFTEIEEYLGNKIDWIGPIYRNEEGKGLSNFYCPIPNVVLLMKSKVSNIQSFVKEFGLKVNEEKTKYLPSFYYLQVMDTKKSNAYELKNKLEELGNKVLLENMPMRKPLTAIPNDTHWANQWDMVKINAPNGWDITTGSSNVVICILDEGCDLTHPDLVYSEQGINLNTMLPPGAPTGPHGTACAGIAAGTINNGEGVSGVAGNCRVMPVAFQFWTDVECAMGIMYATINGADVISMSFGVYDWWGWDYSIIDPAIQNAFDNNVVQVVATGNENTGVTNRYPGKHPLVIAVGGTSTDDNRKTLGSPDGECWGASFGEDVYNGITTGVSVVAPCVQCPTTDIQGAGGYSNNGVLISDPWVCVSYPMQPANGNYIMMFDGTSAATPHVAGLAALIKSKYPTLTNIQIRTAIEVSAAKVGSLPYAVQAGFPNGTRNQEMGYGRIDIPAALEAAEKMVSCKDRKVIANIDLQQMAIDKFHHLKSLENCSDFEIYIRSEENQKKCKPAKFPELRPCFYLHWGDGNQDIIETEDFEVLILSVCNPFENIMFKNIKISGIEVIHSDGTKVELLPDGTPSAMIVPSKLITFCEVDPCSCCHVELVLKTAGAKEGPYKVILDFCIEEICLRMTDNERDRGEVEFDIELIKS